MLNVNILNGKINARMVQIEVKKTVIEILEMKE